MMRETLLDIAQGGVLAPSADNQHVFKITLQDDAIHLWPTSAFAANTERHRHVLGLLSLGAVVENMRLRAAELGFATNVIWLGVAGKTPMTQLHFQPAPTPIAEDIATAIPERHTNRRMYRGPVLSASETAQLSSEVNHLEGIQLIWLRAAARKRALGLIWSAESERFLREGLHDEIFSSIRFDLPWNTTSDVGLPPGALEIEWPMRPLFKALRHWPLMQLLSQFGVHHLVGLRAGWLPCWQAPALGVLATSLPVEQGAAPVGAAFERLWLRATLCGLALQPLAASAVLPLQMPSEKGISAGLHAKLRSGWQEIAPGLSTLMVFRIGRTTQPGVRTTRQPLGDYLI